MRVLVILALFGLAVANKDKSESGESSEERLGYLENVHRYDADKMIKYFLKNPVTKRQLDCFSSKFQSGDSIDFVIDIAPSPSLDKIDEMCANSPIGLFLEAYKLYRSPTRSYFDFITHFIDLVSFGMKPELTHTVIVDKGHKFYLRGRYVNETIDVNNKQYGSDFSDTVRNLKTMWPVSTKSPVEGTKMAKILVNNLGRMTKLALWNRDNGLPTVLNAARHSKPVYSIVLTDGSSGSKINELVDDITRTTVIDIGNNRFVDHLKWDELKKMPSVFTVTAPQSLLAFSNTVRNMACLLGTHYRPEVPPSEVKFTRH